MSDDVWLPARAVTTSDGTSVMYVLRDDGDSRTVLQDSPRLVTVLPNDKIRDERLCAPGGPADCRSLWDLTSGRGRGGAPACPS